VGGLRGGGGGSSGPPSRPPAPASRPPSGGGGGGGGFASPSLIGRGRTSVISPGACCEPCPAAEPASAPGSRRTNAEARELLLSDAAINAALQGQGGVDATGANFPQGDQPLRPWKVHTCENCVGGSPCHVALQRWSEDPKSEFRAHRQWVLGHSQEQRSQRVFESLLHSSFGGGYEYSPDPSVRGKFEKGFHVFFGGRRHRVCKHVYLLFWCISSTELHRLQQRIVRGL
jgi:hypothetical protein